MSAVILPTFQPDKTLVDITDQLWSLGYGIVVVDDGSGEEYQNIFGEIKDVSIILHHETNRGKGAAIKTALQYIKDEMWDCDVIGVMDSDGQHSVMDLQKVLEMAQQHKGEFVLGVREIGKEMPLKSRIGNQCTRKIFELLSGVPLTDTQTGLRAFGSDLIETLLSVKGERYEYEMNVLTEMVKKEIPIKETPIEVIYHDKENSCSHFRTIRDAIRIYKVIGKFALSSFTGFLIDYTLFAVLISCFPKTIFCIVLANVSARAVSGFFNYGLNCHFVFGTKGDIKSGGQYFLLALFILLMNSLILSFFIQIFSMSGYVAKLLTEIILFAISWMVQRRIIFKKEQGM